MVAYPAALVAYKYRNHFVATRNTGASAALGEFALMILCSRSD